MRSCPIPSFAHQTDRAVSPLALAAANGAPLSERSTSGKPCSRKARSNTGRASAVPVLPVAATAIR